MPGADNPYEMAGKALWRKRKYIGSAGYGAYKAARYAAGSIRKRFKRSSTGKGVKSGIGVTTQHDVSSVYRRRRMPKRKRLRWKRFVQKVHAVSERELGTRTVVFNDRVSVTEDGGGPAPAGDTRQICMTFALYPQETTKNWLNDLRQISVIENTGNPTSAAGVTVNDTTKIMFQSGVLDLTVRNITANNEGLTAPAEVDIYEIMIRTNTDDGGIGANSLSDVFGYAQTDTLNIGGAGTALEMRSRGATPFDFPNAISRFGMKVLSKKKYFLQYNATFTYQVRDPKRRTTTIGKIGQDEGLNRPKWTRFLYLIAKPVPGFSVGNAAADFKISIVAGVTRKYMYKIEGANDDRDRYIYSANTSGNPT